MASICVGYIADCLRSGRINQLAYATGNSVCVWMSTFTQIVEWKIQTFLSMFSRQAFSLAFIKIVVSVGVHTMGWTRLWPCGVEQFYRSVIVRDLAFSKRRPDSIYRPCHLCALRKSSKIGPHFMKTSISKCLDLFFSFVCTMVDALNLSLSLLRFPRWPCSLKHISLLDIDCILYWSFCLLCTKVCSSFYVCVSHVRYV
jgi:hypothetical protein